ncbi:PAS domain-containing protein [Sulfurimonas marina]|uniref:Sensory/regulatory protein RpfC n=1 Tax=Sulfurimonas marina TaxID=2590551 RepID=A0A7M1AUQ5_9BACT|nr:PAS domain-containing protein [Sulfurimonas marina]QOP41150.1 PAS domain S-box protein [Sulfurimonas marina]
MDTLNTLPDFSEATKTMIQFMEANGDTYWEFYPTTQKLFISNQIYKILGYKPNEVLLDLALWKKIVHPQDFEKASKQFVSMLEGKISHYHSEIRVQRKDGTYVWLLDRGQISQRDKDGNVTLVTGTHIDITERHTLEQTVMRSKDTSEKTINRLQNVLSVTKDGYWEWDVQTNEVYFSPSWKAMLGYEDDEIENKLSVWKDLLHPDDSFAKEEAQKLAQNAMTDFKIEFRLRCKDGSYKWILSRAKTITKDEYNRPLLIAGTHVDIDDDKKLQDKLQQLNKRFSNMFQNHDAVMLLIDPTNGAIIDANKSAETFYGYKHDELCSMSIGQINTLSDDHVKRKQTEAFNNDKNFFIFDHQLKSGEIRTVEVHSSPIKTDIGELLFSIIIDITQEKENRIKLDKALDQLSQAKKIAKLGIWEYNIAKNELTWSDEIYDLFELDKEKFQPSYEAFLEIIHPGDRERVNNAYIQSLESKKGYKIEHRLLLNNGRIKYVLEQCDTEYDTLGNPVRSLGTVYDISHVQELTNKIDQERKRYKSLMDLASDGIFILDVETGKLLQYSEVTKKLLGYTDEEMQNLTVFDWDKDFTMDDFQEIVKNLSTTPVNLERVHTRKDGFTYLASISAVKIHIDNQDYIYASARNITQEKRLQQQQEELLAEQNSLLSLFDKGDSVLFKWTNDKTWSIVYASENVKRLLGYSKDNFLSNDVTYAACIHQDDIQTVTNEVEEAIQHNLDFFRHKPYRIITKSGEIRWVLDYTVTQKDKDGSITHFIGYITDVTEQKENEIALFEAKQIADKANQAKSEFLANMSHEIRTPLNGIIGLTDVILNSNLDHMQRDYLNKVHSSSHALLHVINDILDYSKIEAGKIDILPIDFQLDTMLKTISDLFSLQIHKKDLKFMLNIDEDIPNKLIGDSLRLTQILNNLIGNAIKFTPNGFISLDIKNLNKTESDITLEFIVQDSGIGIPEEHQENLFKAFEQGDSSTTRKYGGTGLGLMICKKLVTLMGGDIWVESQENQGSSFYFFLTFKYHEELKEKNILHNIDLSTQQQKEQDTIQLKLNTPKNALLVEDNQVNQLVASIYLQEYGFDVNIANNGEEAVKMATKNHYDIIFMDLQMPVMDGFEATKKIRAFDFITPIIALSAAVLEKDKELTLTSGMNGHLAKPIDKEALDNIIKLYFSVTTEIEEKFQEEQALQLEGINIEKLQQNLIIDTQTLYSLYQNFYNSYATTPGIIDKLYKNDLKEFYALIHKIKGASGNLHIDTLYQQAVDIEELGVTSERVSTYIDTLQSVLDEIKTKIIPLVPASNEEKLTQNETLALLEKITKQIENMQYIDQKEIVTLTDSLQFYLSETKTQHIKKLFDKFDEEELQTVLPKIAKEISDG